MTDLHLQPSARTSTSFVSQDGPQAKLTLAPSIATNSHKLQVTSLSAIGFSAQSLAALATVRPRKSRIAACTQAQMSRALRAAKQVGDITVEVAPDGTIRFVPSTAVGDPRARRVDRKREIVL